MPTIACRSKIKAVSDHCSLTLHIRHRLVAGEPSEILHTITKSRFPDEVDVLLTSNLIITLSGTLDGSEVPARVILDSPLAQHLVDYFQTNAMPLGLTTVAKLCLGEDNLPSVMLTSCRQFPLKPEILPVHVLLVALDLNYAWQTSTSSTLTTSKHSGPHPASHPFSHQLSLPFRTVLDNVIERFGTWQLVRRYPLIFGPWCQQLDLEGPYFSKIFSSILSITDRSPNTDFRAKCEQLIKFIRCRHMNKLTVTSSTLKDYLGFVEEEDFSSQPVPVLTNEDVFCLTMDNLYRIGLRRPLFKGLTGVPAADRVDDEELSQDHLQECATETEDYLIWNVDEASANQTNGSIHTSIDSVSSIGSSPRNLNSFPMDTDVLDYDGDSAIEAGSWRDSQERLSSYWGDRFERNSVPIDVDQEANCVTTPSTLGFWEDQDSDSGPSRIRHLQMRRPGVDRNEVAEPETRYFLHDHVPSQGDAFGQNSQDTIQCLLGIGSRSQASASSILPCLPDPPSRQDDEFSGRLQGTDTLVGQPSPLCIYSKQDYPSWSPRDRRSDIYGLDSADLDLTMVSDTDSDIGSYPVEGVLEDHYNLEEFDEEGEGLMPIHLVSSGDANSHHCATLLVTCPHKGCQPEAHQDEREDREPRLREHVERILDEGDSADRYPEEYLIDDWSEDGVMDF